jgi:segregation and condensation protein A
MGWKTDVHAVFVFLSILELVQEQQIQITIGEGYNNFWLEKTGRCSTRHLTG